MSRLQFCLPKAEKERYEKEERPESQQEILWRAASSLPLYTRTGAGGTFGYMYVPPCWNCPVKTRMNSSVDIRCSNPLLRPLPGYQARQVSSLLRVRHVRNMFGIRTVR